MNLVNKRELKAWFIRRGYTQEQVQKAIGIKSQSTFSRKLKNNSFTLKEAQAMIDLLEIDNPATVFFCES